MVPAVESKAGGVTSLKIPCVDVTFTPVELLVATPTITVFPVVVAFGNVSTIVDPANGLTLAMD